MPRYSCTVLFDASTGISIEAESPEDAAEKALDLKGNVSICHQCSDELEVGDAMGVMVYDNDANDQVLDTTWASQKIESLEARVRELESQLAATQGATHDNA